MFIVMTFAGGIPLLYPIGMLCAFTTYWVDKWLFVRFYRSPPLYDGQMATTARSALKCSIFIHCVMSLYMYSNEEIFKYEEGDAALFGKLNKKLDELLATFGASDVRERVALPQQGAGEYLSLSTGHAVLYVVGLAFFLVVVILQEVFGVLGFFGRVISFLSRDDANDKELQLFMQRRVKAQLQQLQLDGQPKKESPEPEPAANQVAPAPASVLEPMIENEAAAGEEGQQQDEV